MQIQQDINKQKLLLPGQIVSTINCKYDDRSFKENKEGLKCKFMGYKYQQNDKKQNKVLTLVKEINLYSPMKSDLIIGIIKIKNAQYYIVDINAPQEGILGAFQFDRATKKNKPNINIAGLIFARIIVYNQFTGARLSCINKGFNTNNQLGQLKGGTIISVPSYQQILIKNRIGMLSKSIKFQIIFACNGYIWINTKSTQHLLVLRNLLLYFLSNNDEKVISTMIERLKI